MFLLIIVSVLIADVLWWLWADQKLRGTRHARVWRTLLGVWSGLLLGYLLWFILFSAAARHAHAWMPIWALAIVYVWHLLVLPATVLLMIGDRIVALARRVFEPAPPSQPDPAPDISR